MQPLLDHEDFNKSRKALLASAALLLLAQHVSLTDSGQKITLMSLQIEHGAILGLGCLSVLYFSWVFIFRCFDQAVLIRDEFEATYITKLASLRADSESTQQEYDEATTARSDDVEPHALAGRIQVIKNLGREAMKKRYLFDKASSKYRFRSRLRIVIFCLVETAPPILLTIWVLWHMDIFGSVGRFLMPTHD